MLHNLLLTNIGPIPEGSIKYEATLEKVGVWQTHKNDNMYNNDTNGNKCQSSLRRMRALSPGLSSSAICCSSIWKFFSMLPLHNESVLPCVKVIERNDWLNEWLVIWKVEINLVPTTWVSGQYGGAGVASRRKKLETRNVTLSHSRRLGVPKLRVATRKYSFGHRPKPLRFHWPGENALHG